MSKETKEKPVLSDELALRAVNELGMAAETVAKLNSGDLERLLDRLGVKPQSTGSYFVLTTGTHYRNAGGASKAFGKGSILELSSNELALLKGKVIPAPADAVLSVGETIVVS